MYTLSLTLLYLFVLLISTLHRIAMAPTVVENANHIARLTQELDAMKTNFSTLIQNYTDMHAQFREMHAANKVLQCDVINLKETANLQAAKIAHLEAGIDDASQYSRRENVVFTNLSATTNEQLVDDVISLCDQIGVSVEKNEICAAHPLPAKKGQRHVVRFINRSKAQEIFKHRRNCKNMDPTKKRTLTKVADRGIGIMTHLTPKRAALYRQVCVFRETYNFDSVWVDYNTARIFLRRNAGERAHVITDTSDLYKLNSDFTPTEYHFCIPPIFTFPTQASQSPSSPYNLVNSSKQFSPQTPAFPRA